MRHTLLAITFWGLLTFVALGQYAGQKFIQNFSPQVYGAGVQNWTFAEDDRGLIYVGNNQGVLIYDGLDWRKLVLPNHGTLRGLCKHQNIIYAAGDSEFGFLYADSLGETQFESLIPKFDSLHRFSPTNFIWRLISAKEGVYVYSDEKLVLWDGKKSTAWYPPSGKFYSAFEVDERVFVYQKDLGIFEALPGGVLDPIPEGDFLLRKYVSHLLKFSSDEWLFPLRKSGFYLYNEAETQDGERWKKLTGEGWEKVQQANPYSATQLDDGNFAFGTLKSGLFVLSPEGVIVMHANQENNLQDNIIINIFQASDRSLWLGLNNGISRVEYGTRVTFWDETAGLLGDIQDVVESHGTVLVAGVSGISYFQDGKFVKIPETDSHQFWDLQVIYPQSTKDSVILAAGSGVGLNEFSMREGSFQSSKIGETKAVFKIAYSENRPNQVIIGSKEGVHSLEYSGGRWSEKKGVDSVADEIRNMAFDSEGDIWAVTARGSGKVYRLAWGDELNLVATYDQTNNVKERVSLNLFSFGGSGKVLLGEHEGVRYWNTNSSSFLPFYDFGEKFFGTMNSIYSLTEAPDQSIWIIAYDEQKEWIEHITPLPDGTYRSDSISWRRIPNMLYANVKSSTRHPGKVWFTGSEGLFLADTEERNPRPYNTLIRKVIGNGDSLIFAGNPTALSAPNTFPYATGQLDFHFTSTDFDAPEKRKFQYKLEGNDVEWSGWTDEPKKSYTNLWEGKYTFRVRAMNSYGEIGKEATYTFSMLPPWYRHPVAFAFYGLLAIVTLVGLIKLNTYRLKQDKKKLEAVIAERTSQVRAKNTELEQQKEEISSQSEHLKAANDEIMRQNREIEQRREEIESQSEQLRKINDQLVLREAIISKKNQDITDSISYAERIQRAILPEVEQIRKYLPESFVFFRPRDIVSGDFYWFGREEGNIILAAVDCTGHGVPGAFMSMIGNEALNEIVHFRKETRSDQVLNKLHLRILETLKQKESQVNDGMEMTLCTISDGAGHLQFAGARNPLIFIKDGELHEIKGDRLPIGGSQVDRERAFTLHAVPLKNGDGSPVTFYMFSDGYQDQFGGADNRKFMAGKLKSLLLDIHALPMDEQEKILKERFNSWKGSEEQVDDILVMGFRVTEIIRNFG